MSGAERAVKWERLAVLRSPVLLLAGLVCLCVAAFLWAVAAGWAAVGVSLILVAYLTETAPEGSADVRR